MFDFDFGGGASSLRRLRERMEESLPESPAALWNYPVLKEKCGCGASTEVESFDEKRAEAHFSKWREAHGCPLRVKQNVT